MIADLRVYCSALAALACIVLFVAMLWAGRDGQ